MSVVVNRRSRRKVSVWYDVSSCFCNEISLATKVRTTAASDRLEEVDMVSGSVISCQAVTVRDFFSSELYHRLNWVVRHWAYTDIGYDKTPDWRTDKPCHTI